jgi:hypothetical protein
MASNNPKKYSIETSSRIEIWLESLRMNLSFESTGETNGMMRKTGLDADPGL